ncbi:MAG: hypothetical protein IPG92_00825 [Flavobacteriales bacterium]|nr:hypothetical protein [Flavobacteriales bacterium]
MRASYSLLIWSFLLTTFIQAQTNVSISSYTFSNGVHPTISFLFEGTDVKYVEGFWRDELKRMSQEVSSKKEVIGAGALLPQVSPDTVRVLVKAEQRKGSPMLTAHVAILTRSGWVGPDSDPAVFEGAKSFVQERSTALRRQLAQQELTKAERALMNLRNDLSGLQRDKERAEAGIEKSKQKAAEALQEQERTQKDLDELVPKVEAQRAANTTTPNEENAKLLSDLLKQQSRLQDKHRKALDDERAMKKKADDLAWDIRKNVEDQARKSEEIARQETLVASLREKLAAIH